MRPKRYPYSVKRRDLERQILRAADIKTSIIGSNDSNITFSGDKIFLKGQSIIGV